MFDSSKLCNVIRICLRKEKLIRRAIERNPDGLFLFYNRALQNQLLWRLKNSFKSTRLFLSTV